MAIDIVISIALTMYIQSTVIDFVTRVDSGSYYRISNHGHANSLGDLSEQKTEKGPLLKSLVAMTANIPYM